MSAAVFAFPQRKKGPEPWTNEELAELYRVVDILARAGLATETDMGLSDEGDPWFVFCRADTGDVIAHFARIDGQFVAASVAIDETYKGANFRQIVDQMVRSQPLMLPPPGPGTRLLLHPVVILTAFVATALAHSEKAMAADTMRPVDAKWDVHHTQGSDAGHAKGAKASWLDSVHSMLRNPVADSKGNHDGLNGASTSSGQGVSLASLIAIAMTAMQPLVDKWSFISEAVAAEHAGQGQSSLAPSSWTDKMAAVDLPSIEQTAIKAGDAIVLHADDYTEIKQTRKELQDLHTTADQLKVADYHSSSSQLQKALVAPVEDASHAAAPAPELVQDVGLSTIILAQKLAAGSSSGNSTAIVSSAAVTSDSSTQVTPAIISIDKVSAQALQILGIHTDGGSSLGSSTHDSGTDTSSSTQPPSVPATGDQLAPLHVSTQDGNVAVLAISNFITSGIYDFKSEIHFSASLDATLAQFADSSQPVKIVVFEGSNMPTDIFTYTPGVVFVAEKYFADSGLALESSAGHLVLDNASNGGSLTLIGVATVDINHPTA